MPNGISAIVCTYNRVGHLIRCLESLTRQSLSEGRFEVIVVDNNSTDGTREAVETLCNTNRHFRYVFAPKQGLAHARNVGMIAASFEFCAFTDDDAIVPPGWAEALLNRFESLPGNTAALGGEIVADFEVPPPSWLTDDMCRAMSARLLWSDKPKFCGQWEWLCEANSAYRKSDVIEFGGFPEHLGRIGTNLLSGENAINLLMAAKSKRFFFDPTITVKHFIPASRLTKEWIRRRYFWQGITAFMVQEYLRGYGLDEAPWSMLEVPMDAASWMRVFNEGHDHEFIQSLAMLTNLGYLLASQRCIGGR